MATKTQRKVTRQGPIMDETISKTKTKKQLLTGRTVVKETNAFIRTDFDKKKTDASGTRTKTVYGKGGNQIKKKTKVLGKSAIFGI